MTIDVYTSAGAKKGTLELPASVFEASVNEGLMHQAVIRVQSNRRNPIAHVKSRGEVRGSTRKLYQQKGTGRARRGSIRSPLLKGGGKAFGPRNSANFSKDMPKKMRGAALRSCLSLQAKNRKIIGLESYPEAIKTKILLNLMAKLPVDIGRKILFVTPGRHDALMLSARNIPGVMVVNASFINPEDVLSAWNIVFFVDAVKAVEEVFGIKDSEATKATKAIEAAEGTKATRESRDIKSRKIMKSIGKESPVASSRKPRKSPTPRKSS